MLTLLHGRNMRMKKTTIVFGVLFILLIGSGIFLWVRATYYAPVVKDVANICSENSTTAAMPKLKTTYVRKSHVDTYIKDAIASDQCVYKK